MPESFEQIPYEHSIVPYDPQIFADNPEPRCPCLLLLDTSGSMAGRPISELNAGLQAFKQQIRVDELASKRVEVAVVTFGPVKCEADFQTAEFFEPPTLSAAGDTPMGAAIARALSMINERKSTYRNNGIEYYRPWIFMITDGSPTDSWRQAAEQVHKAEKNKQVQFFAVGVKGANFEILREISVRAPLLLDGLRFGDLFTWLSNSLGAISHSSLTEEVPLANPTAPHGWASVG